MGHMFTSANSSPSPPLPFAYCMVCCLPACLPGGEGGEVSPVLSSRRARTRPTPVVVILVRGRDPCCSVTPPPPSPIPRHRHRPSRKARTNRNRKRRTRALRRRSVVAHVARCVASAWLPFSFAMSPPHALSLSLSPTHPSASSFFTYAYTRMRTTQKTAHTYTRTYTRTQERILLKRPRLLAA